MISYNSIYRGYNPLVNPFMFGIYKGPMAYITPDFSPMRSQGLHSQDRDPLDWEDDKFPKMSERDVGGFRTVLGGVAT